MINIIQHCLQAHIRLETWMLYLLHLGYLFTTGGAIVRIPWSRKLHRFMKCNWIKVSLLPFLCREMVQTPGHVQGCGTMSQRRDMVSVPQGLSLHGLISV